MKRSSLRQLTAASLLLLTVPAMAGQITGSSGITPLFSSAEIAAAEKDPLFFTIDPESVKTVVKAPLTQTEIREITAAQPETRNPVVIIGEIINIALKVWDIIQQNAPTVGIETKYATAVPKGIESWSQLTGWSKPTGYLYNVSATNTYGSKCVDIDFKVIYTAGGQYEGKGKYLTAVTVIPSKVDVNWGYHVALTAQVPDSTVINMGTMQDPIAALQLVVVTKMSTVLKDTTFTNSYYIDGNGNMEEVSGPFSAAKVKNVGSAQPLMNTENVF